MTLSIDKLIKIRDEQVEDRKRSAKANRKKNARDRERASKQRAQERRLKNFSKAYKYAQDL